MQEICDESIYTLLFSNLCPHLVILENVWFMLVGFSCDDTCLSWIELIFDLGMCCWKKKIPFQFLKWEPHSFTKVSFKVMIFAYGVLFMLTVSTMFWVFNKFHQSLVFFGFVECRRNLFYLLFFLFCNLNSAIHNAESESPLFWRFWILFSRNPQCTNVDCGYWKLLLFVMFSFPQSVSNNVDCVCWKILS